MMSPGDELTYLKFLMQDCIRSNSQNAEEARNYLGEFGYYFRAFFFDHPPGDSTFDDPEQHMSKTMTYFKSFLVSALRVREENLPGFEEYSDELDELDLCLDFSPLKKDVEIKADGNQNEAK